MTVSDTDRETAWNEYKATLPCPERRFVRQVEQHLGFEAGWDAALRRPPEPTTLDPEPYECDRDLDARAVSPECAQGFDHDFAPRPGYVQERAAYEHVAAEDYWWQQRLMAADYAAASATREAVESKARAEVIDWLVSKYGDRSYMIAAAREHFGIGDGRG